MIMITFIYSAVLGGLAGILVAPVLFVSIQMGSTIALKAFAATIIGGFGDVAGAIIGGLALGIIETFGAAYISVPYKDGFAFLVLVLFLIFRPQKQHQHQECKAVLVGHWNVSRPKGRLCIPRAGVVSDLPASGHLRRTRCGEGMSAPSENMPITAVVPRAKPLLLRHLPYFIGAAILVALAATMRFDGYIHNIQHEEC